MGTTIGIGFLGGGPVTQAIHLPVLATMSDRFHVARVMDVDAHVAEGVAARCGAAASTSANEIFDDPAVEIVAICSPNQFHAEQAIAACRAGKRLVLCEKPLAVSTAEAEEIGRIARETSTPIIVGTMHAYDPGYRAAHAAWIEAGEDRASFVASSIYLPANEVFIDQATDLLEGVAPPQRGGGNPADRAFQIMMLRSAILGLAIHNIPLIRQFYPSVGSVASARQIPIFGYAIAATHERAGLQLNALMPSTPRPHWSLRAIGKQHELRIHFPPSYVLGGSARGTLVARNEERVFEAPRNGYEAMWSHVSDVVGGTAEPVVGLDTLIADLEFAVELADRSAEYLGAQP